MNFFEKIINATYWQLFLTWIVINLACSALYFSLATTYPEHAPVLLPEMDIGHRLFNSLYFSVITATSIGYGDIVPLGFSKVIAMLESAVTLMIFAVFVTKLVTHKQDIALHNIHKFSFESTFQRIREELFIMRKDFDAIIRDLHTAQAIPAHAWENLSIACSEGQTILEEIPRFYDQVNDFYTIDKKRESLLLEGIRRTLQRLQDLINTVKTNAVDMPATTQNALRTFADGIPASIDSWKKLSPHANEESFADLQKLSMTLRGTL